MAKLLIRRRDRRKAEKQARKGKNPWDRPLPGIDEDDPHSVQDGLMDRLGELAALHHRIGRHDDELMRHGEALHDHHRDEAAKLEEEIRRVGVGSDPLLENAHMHHLQQRQIAEEALVKLRNRTDHA